MAKGKQATWGGRFEGGPSELMEAFSESVSFDRRLAAYDIRCSQAHASMLKEVGLLSASEHAKIRSGLKELAAEIEAGRFEWDPRLEDVHMNIERALTERVPEAARLHTGRSRNDQVATDMRLYFKEAATNLQKLLDGLLRALLGLGRESLEAGIVIPGYTHLQRAQPVPAAHHLAAYLEMFERDRIRFGDVLERANACPLGSGALAGSTLPLNRETVAVELGFVDTRGRPLLTRNSMDAVADRDLYLDFAGAASTCALHLSRVAEDLILWNSAEFQFVELPDAFTTGSSLMPQKKNPDALELIRGKTGRILGQFHGLQVMIKGLPLTYNRDLQEDKPAIFDLEEQCALCLRVLAAMLAEVRFRKERTDAAVADPLLLATDLADFLVEAGVPFREAHHQVGVLVRVSEQSAVPLPELGPEELSDLGFSLPEGWQAVFSIERALKKRSGVGMPGWKPVKAELRRWERLLEKRA